jgi:hypothetical protein
MHFAMAFSSTTCDLFWNFEGETNLVNEMIKSMVDHILHLHFTTMEHAMKISIKINFIIVAICIKRYAKGDWHL